MPREPYRLGGAMERIEHIRGLAARLAPLVSAVVLASVLAGAGPAAAQSGETSNLADELVACAAVQDEGERLACYDGLAQPLARLDAKAVDEDEILHKFSGKNDGDSDTVEIGQPWRAVWQSDVSILTIELREPDNSLIGTIGFQIGKGGGRSEVQRPGVYKLAMRGTGSWQVNIIPAD
jgi:hypothetical protein